MASRLELTLAILKPHVIPNIFAHRVIKEKIVEKGFQIVQSKTFRVDESLAGDFYAEHSKKFFYGRLVSFMSSGPVEVLILAKNNAIAEWRELLGPTKVYKTVISHPESIRGMFGLTDTRNVGHGSGKRDVHVSLSLLILSILLDSPETSAKEIQFFFPEFSIANWIDCNENKIKD